MTRQRQTLGARGEALVADWYLERGYSILDRNWRCRTGELDLVVTNRTEVVFCEVKTRSSTAFGLPVEAVTRAKQRRLRQLAAEWISQAERRPRRVRFDVAGVLGDQIDVIEGAF